MSEPIVVVGSLNYDLVSFVDRIPHGGETLVAKSFKTGCGGKGANQAVAAARLAGKNGAVVRMIGAVGNDSFGDTMRYEMEKQGVDLRDVKRIENAATGVAVIIVEEGSGENRILIHPGANASVQPSSLPSSLFSSPLPSLLILQLECPLETVLHTIKLAATSTPRPIPVLFNPAPAITLPEWIYPIITILVVNETEASILSGIKFPSDESEASDLDIAQCANDAAEWFVSKGCKNVIVTLGARGALYQSPRSKKIVPAIKTTVLDTTAAGDTFIGGLSVKLVEHWSSVGTADDTDEMEEAVKYAIRCSAWTVARKGTWDAMPLKEDLL